MLTIVGWLWKSEKWVQYKPEYVNIWARMIHQNITLPHRFVVLTDHPQELWGEFDPLVQPMKLWNDWRTLQGKWGGAKPNCYVRLRAFSPDVRELFGDRFVSIDLDCVVIGNLDEILGRSEDFLIYHRASLNRPREAKTWCNGSMWMMNTGARERVWTQFKGPESVAKTDGGIGTDQSWIAECLDSSEAGWTFKDGVVSFPTIQADSKFHEKPPDGCKILFFPGRSPKPFDFPNLKLWRQLPRKDRRDYERGCKVPLRRWTWISEAYWKYADVKPVGESLKQAI